MKLETWATTPADPTVKIAELSRRFPTLLQRLRLNDIDLVRRLREQDPIAVQHLHECYLPSVWRFVFVRVDGNRHLAEDIISETVLALIRAVASGETEITNPVGWLRAVANRKVQDHYRAVARVQHLIDQVKHSANDSKKDGDPSKHHELQERRAEVRAIMDSLPEQHRQALEWKYIDKLSVREIAGRLGATEKAAESVLFRARRDFRERLTSTEVGEATPKPPPAGRSNEKRCSAQLPGPDRSAHESANNENDLNDDFFLSIAKLNPPLS